MPPAEARAVVHEAIELLDRGEARVAEVVDGEVVVHEWLKQAILLLFRLSRAWRRSRPGRSSTTTSSRSSTTTRRREVRVVPGGIGALGLVPRARA